MILRRNSNMLLNIEIHTPKATMAQGKVMDARGRVASVIDMQLQAGINKSDISIEGPAEGVYKVKVINNIDLNCSHTI